MSAPNFVIVHRNRLAVVFMAGLVAAVYWQGLAGDFLLDDWVNLNALGRYGGVYDWNGLLRYLTSGVADPTGRPLSMASFLIDARDWPADPRPFKRTNVLLHLGNGALLYSTLSALGKLHGLTLERARLAGLMAAAVWLLHPLWVSTVLYIVQRHAMLAAFFVLAGMRLWLAGIAAFRTAKSTLGWWMATTAIVGCCTMAVLSKANGALLPLLLLALHATVLASPARPAAERRAIGLLLVVPAVAVLVLLALQAWDAAHSMLRPWTVAERLMTQPRAVFDYLFRLLVPGIGATGLFADGFPVSTGWLRPPSTLLAMIGLLAITACAWAVRRSWPLLSAAWLFFLAGHLMESSIVPLELYFEHRNYLPAALLFWPAAVAIASAKLHRRWLLAGVAGFLVLCVLTTLAQVRLWADPSLQAKVWAAQLPDSPRAQAHAASYEIREGNAHAAVARIQPLLAQAPAELQYSLKLVEARCVLGSVPTSELEAAEVGLRHHGVMLDMAYQWLATTLMGGNGVVCGGLPNEHTGALVRAIVASNRKGGSPSERTARIARLNALQALRENNCEAALSGFNLRLDIQRRPEFAHEQVGLLAMKCGERVALAHLDHYMAGAAKGDHPPSKPVLRLRDRIIAHQGFWDEEWTRLRGVLQEDMRAE